jgi:hypothetical protein
MPGAVLLLMASGISSRAPPLTRCGPARRNKNMSNSNVVLRKKRGRPPIGQDPVLSFRLGLGFKQAIDHWRRTGRDKLSRSEAIRWLIGQGLAVELKKREKRDRAPALSPKEGPA